MDRPSERDKVRRERENRSPRLDADTYLSTALDDIEGAHHGVGDSAGEDSTDHALGIVACIMNVTHFSALFM